MLTWPLAFATIFLALRSAWYWYKSSQVYAVPDWVEVGREEPNYPLQVQLGWMSALMKASGESEGDRRCAVHADAATMMCPVYMP